MATKISTNNGVIFFYLEDYMKRNCLSVQDLADLLGKSYNQAVNIKNGNTNSLSFDVIATLCRRFNCQPGQLLEYQKVSTQNIKSINEVNVVLPTSIIKEMSNNTNVEVSIHILLHEEDGFILYGSPELDLFSEVEIPEQTAEQSITQIVLEDFKNKFHVKKDTYRNVDDFLLKMQRLNHWYYDELDNSFVPMSLDYYRSNYFVIKRMLDKPNSKILKTTVIILLNSDEIQFT
jgi:DNA-binding Xre family transcriptional regulator